MRPCTSIRIETTSPSAASTADADRSLSPLASAERNGYVSLMRLVVLCLLAVVLCLSCSGKGTSDDGRVPRAASSEVAPAAPNAIGPGRARLTTSKATSRKAPESDDEQDPFAPPPAADAGMGAPHEPSPL